MRDVIEDDSRRIRPASIFAYAVVSALSVAVVYNALFAQPPGSRVLFADEDPAIPQGATTHLQVDAASGGRTIQLKYDPLVEAVQRELLAAGYYKGTVDGVVGRRTRQAIEAYQKSQGLEVTGRPSSELADHIRYTREIAEASLFTGSIAADPAAEERAQIRRVQTGLAELAYSPGEISGEMNAQTESAISQFQKDRGMAVTGQISPELMAELTKLSGQSDMLAN